MLTLIISGLMLFCLGLRWQHPFRAHSPGLLHFYPSYLLTLWESSSESPGFSDPYSHVRELEEVLGSELYKQGSCSTGKRGFFCCKLYCCPRKPMGC